MKKTMVIMDGNEAAASVAYPLSEVVAIYPITPSSAMGEWCDEWAAKKIPNIWGSVPAVTEMQSEGGAAGAVHGALQAGALTTTFTASQGLLLMIPNLFKIAGELTSAVIHVTARTVATHGLSIFGDHSDVMAARATGFAMLASASVQEAHDLALVAHSATLKTRLPFIHFFDGFRTSHEINKIEKLPGEVLRAMIDDDLVAAHRARGLSPEHPFIRGTAQNADVFFQSREAANRFYLACPDQVQATMDELAGHTGRSYHLFDYHGAPDAERVIVLMGSGAVTAAETARVLVARGEKVGVVQVRLYRPFSVKHFLAALPATVKSIAVLDRTKEPGATGEPLYQDVFTALGEGWPRPLPTVIGGRFGLACKDFTPAMVKAVFDHLRQEQPAHHFTIGIEDDVTGLSLPYDPAFTIESPDTVRCVFWGLGSDGTVGANHNSIRIIGEETDNFAQGYFVYDSKRAGVVTTSHLRFGPHPIQAPYLIGQAQFVACHQFSFLERFDVLRVAAPGGVFLLNSIYGPDEVWQQLPRETQQQIIEKRLRFFVVDAYEVARQTGMGGRINTIMQTCFFAISAVLPRETALAAIKGAIERTYRRRGEAVVRNNLEAVDQAVSHLFEVKVPRSVSGSQVRRIPVSNAAPEFVRKVTGKMIALEGDDLPVSAFPVDGTYPSATTRWEKRNLSLEIPAWEPELCIQCGKCSFVCPHAAIREKVYPAAYLDGAPEGWASASARWKEFPDQVYTLAVAPEDCTGCGLCIEACPAKDKANPERKAINLTSQPPIRQREGAKWEYFLGLPEVDRTSLSVGTVKNSQLLEPLFEFSGACPGCGETPYLKLLSQLFGDRVLVANATGCSSIQGGNLPTTPWAFNREGRGPAWANSLFEDNAEFGLGMRLTVDKQEGMARELLQVLAGEIGESLVTSLLEADQRSESGIRAQRERVEILKHRLQDLNLPAARSLYSLADALVRKSVWIVGGDGWAYDIGYGGLDHVLASGRNVNVLVLDTEVYSNTGGQSSKATSRAAVARFAAQGKSTPKKDLGRLAMTYGSVYIAQVAMGAGDQHTLTAFMEADAYDGPSLIIAYSHCAMHGLDLRQGLAQQKLAVQAGYWLLYRYNPLRAEAGQNPLLLDCKEPSIPLSQYAYNENRFQSLVSSDEARAELLLDLAQKDIQRRWKIFQQMAKE